MSYEPTSWKLGDVVTSAKLNKIEQGVKTADMSYTPTIWAKGDIVTAEKLNNIEQGILNAGGGGDFSTATVTIANNAGTTFSVTVTGIRVSSGEMAYYPEAFGNLYSTEWDVVLYSGSAGIEFAAGSNIHLTVTGDITVDDNDTNEPYVTVSGDGTISITLAD